MRGGASAGTIDGVRLLFADQLGPHFYADLADDEQVLLVESRQAFRRRRAHRQKAHIILTALRRLAHDLDGRAIHVSAPSYGEALAGLGIDPREVSVVDPTSYAARRWVREQGMTVLPARGFTLGENDFQEWLGTRRPILEDFYRWQRRRLGILMEPDGEPEGGRWNFDADNRLPPPKKQRTLGLPEPAYPVEDSIDAALKYIIILIIIYQKSLIARLFLIMLRWFLRILSIYLLRFQLKIKAI